MGATGICWDYAGAESLWSTFKHEYYYRRTFRTKTELIAAVDNWMHFYNHERRNSAIGMRSPHLRAHAESHPGSKLTNPVRVFWGTPSRFDASCWTSLPGEIGSGRYVSYAYDLLRWWRCS